MFKLLCLILMLFLQLDKAQYYVRSSMCKKTIYCQNYPEYFFVSLWIVKSQEE